MYKFIAPTVLIAISFIPPSPARGQPTSFEAASIHIEYSATDDDAEAVITLRAGVPMRQVSIYRPDGKRAVLLSSKTIHDLGLNTMKIETPEPSLAEVLLAFPEGSYRFVGLSEDGQALLSTCLVSHVLPPAPTISFPVDGASGVPVHGSTGAWGAVAGAVGYEVQLDQDDLLLNLKIGTTQDMTSMSFPDSWMQSNRPYVFGVAAIGANGNVTVTETIFTTGN